MNAVHELLRRAEAVGLRLWLEGERIRYRGPDTPEVRALLVELRQHRQAVLEALQGRAAPPTPQPTGPLLDHALSMGAHPPCKFTLRESEDVEGDCQLMARIASLIGEFPGQEPVVMTIVTLDGRRRRFLWRARATRELRRELSRLLREMAAPALEGLPPHGPDYCARCRPVPGFEALPYRLCRRRGKAVLVRHISDPQRHVLRLPEPSVCVEVGVWQAAQADMLVVKFAARGWGWQRREVIEREAEVIDRGYGRQLRIPLRALRREWWQEPLAGGEGHALP